MITLKVDKDIELKQFTATDAKALFQVVHRNRTHLKQWLPWLDVNRSAHDSLGFINASLDRFKVSKEVVFGIWFKKELVGTVGINRIDWTNKHANIGYWLGNGYQGHGIISLSCKTLINYIFNELKLNLAVIRAATENKKSRSIPERLGFKFEGILQQQEWLYDHYVDHASYSMTRDQWFKIIN